jgi:hypothetical protein
MFIAPKDRLVAIIKSEPLELEGEAYKGKYELNTKKRTAVFKWLRKEFQGETMKNPDWKQEAGRNKGYPDFDYFITPVKMDGKDYTILSEVGKNSNGEYYYYQNVFEGNLPEVIEKARGLSNRSSASLADAKEQTSHNKYNKFLEIMQGIYGKNFENNKF